MSLFIYNNINNFIELNRIILEKGINLSVNNYENIKKIFKSYQKELNKIKSRENKKHI